MKAFSRKDSSNIGTFNHFKKEFIKAIVGEPVILSEEAESVSKVSIEEIESFRSDDEVCFVQPVAIIDFVIALELLVVQRESLRQTKLQKFLPFKE